MKTPLQIAQEELTEMKRVLAHLERRLKREDHLVDATALQIAAVKKHIAAFTHLVNDPIALQSWWDSISPAGQEMMM